ncbi:heavy-metal-associated domain-containing protein [Aeromicrobium sp.]
MSPTKQPENHRLHIEGMSCGSCANHVREALGDVAGVEEARVDLRSDLATVTGTSIDRDRLIEAVARAGYEVRV